MDSNDLPDIPDEPLEYQWRPRAMVDFPAEMVVALAQGLEEPENIAVRFGIGPDTWKTYAEYPPLKAAVEAKRAELSKNGWVVRTKAAMQAEMLMDQVFVQSMSHDTGLGMKLETLKTLIKVGGLEPKEDKMASAGAGFQIQINLGDQSVSLGSSRPRMLANPPIDILEIPLEGEE
jgi:hypothetical protein